MNLILTFLIDFDILLTQLFLVLLKNIKIKILQRLSLILEYTLFLMLELFCLHM